MKGFEKRICGIRCKVFIFSLILTSILGTVVLTTLGKIHIEDIKDMNLLPNVTPAPIRVATIEITPRLFLAPVPKSSPIPSVPMPEAIPSGTVYPRPTNVPSLMEYEINKDSSEEIWHAENPELYIVPNNEWVKSVASELYVNKDGRTKYKNKPIPHTVEYNGNIVLWTDEPFLNHYVSDDELFNFPANADMWQNADYYLSHGMRGDCEDWAIALTSMMLSGEMSIKENGTYVRQVIPAKVVIGYSGKSRDMWTEYSVHGNIYVSSTGTEFNPGTGKEESYTIFHPEGEWRGRFEPIYQFTNKNFGRYSNS